MSANVGNGGAGHWNRWRAAGWSAAGLLLLAPLLAMGITDEVDWSLFDFAFMAVLIGLVGLGLELALTRGGNGYYRAAAVVALLATFFLVWLNGAVSLIGGEEEDAGVLYALVPLVGLLGAVAARFRPAGMAWALLGMALAQALVPVAAWATGLAPSDLVASYKVFARTGMFCGAWLLSALLFRNAAA